MNHSYGEIRELNALLYEIIIELIFNSEIYRQENLSRNLHRQRPIKYKKLQSTVMFMIDLCLASDGI